VGNISEESSFSGKKGKLSIIGKRVKEEGGLTIIIRANWEFYEVTYWGGHKKVKEVREGKKFVLRCCFNIGKRI